MGVFCVNTKSKDFLNTAKRLDIHPDSLEVYVHLFLNSIAVNDYMEATDELPFPSDEQIREYFSLGNRESGTQAIDAWVQRYGATDGFISDSEVNEATRLYGTGNVHTYMNYAGNIVHRVSRPNITNKKDLKYFLIKLNIIDNKGNLLGISREKFYDRMRNLAIPASLYMQFDKELKDEVSLVFKRNPELSLIGTEELYIQYLATLFPNSLDKSIYWHGSNEDFSEGFKSAKRGEGSGALETKNRNDFYLAKQAWSVLLYVNGVNRKSVDKNGFAHWNKLWWEFKEIMSNGRRQNNDWKDLIIDEQSVRQAIPNKKGIFNRDKGGENGKWLKERKADYNYENKTDKEFFEEILGVKWGEDTFNTWTLRNAEIFKSLEATEKGIYPAIINTVNPIRETGQNTYYEEQRGLMSKADKEGYDAILGTNTDNEFGSDVAVVLNNNNKVYFLGTLEDKSNFADFVAKEFPTSINSISNDTNYTLEMLDIREQAIADGTFMTAPNGKPTNLNERQWLQVRTKAFKEWFGDWINDPTNASKVVDENGEPKVMLRTDDAGKTIMGRGDGGAFFATDNLLVAGSYASDEADLYKGFVNLKNPYIVKGESHGFFFEYKGRETTVQEAQPSLMQEGYDGVYFERTWDVGDYADVEPEDNYWATNIAMFNPNQIKSATDNVGTFSTVNNNIYYESESNTINNNPKTPIKAKYKGKLIFAQSGTGKTTIADNETVIDSDTILASILGVNTALATPAMQLLPWSEKEKVIKEYHRRIKLAVKEGKTVVTSSKALMKDADLIVLQPNIESALERTSRADRSNRVSSVDYQQSLFDEALNVEKSKIIHLKENQYLSDIILTDPSFNILVERINDKELIDILESFMLNFGVSLEEFTEQGYSIDFLDRIIKGFDLKDVIDGSGEFIAFMMQYNSQEKEIIANLAVESGEIERSEMFITDKKGNAVINDRAYKSLNKGTYIKTIGQAISEELKYLYDQVKKEGTFDYNHKIKNSFFLKVIDIIKEFLNIISSNRNTIEQLLDFSSYVAINVLQDNPAMITASLRKPGDEDAGPVSKVDLIQALDENPYERDILLKLSNKGIVLAGSAAMSTQISVYRPAENPLHDIDFQTNGNINREQLESLIFPLFPNIEHTNTITNSNYTTETYLILDRPFKIEKALEGINGYWIKDLEGNILGSFLHSNLNLKDGVKGKFLDFFTKLTVKYKPVEFDYHGQKVAVANYRSAMDAKIKYGRLKDIFDFNRAVPIDFQSRPSYKETVQRAVNYNEHEFYTIASGNRDKRLWNLWKQAQEQNTSTSLKDIISLVEQDSRYGSIIELLKNISKKHSQKLLLGVKVELVNPLAALSRAEEIRKAFKHGHRAYYNAQNHTIYIDVSAFYRNGNAASVILHEIMHAITIDRILNNPAYKKEFLTIIDRYNSQLKLKEGVPYIDITTLGHAIEEFIADIWSNERTILNLKRMTSAEKQKASLWDKIKSFFKRVLFEGAEDNSLFAQASDTLYRLLEQPVASNGMYSVDVYFESLQQDVIYNTELKEAIKQAGEYLADNEAAEDFFLITGPAGTGKTTIINEIIKNEIARTGRTPSVYVTAVANKAVRTLSNKIDVKHTRRATATALGLQMSRNRDGELEFKFPKKFDPNKIPIAASDIVIIDEASMLNTLSLKAVMQVKLMFPNKKFIMLGDINQLEGIELADETEIVNVFTYGNKREARLISRVRQGDTSPILPYSDEFRVDTIDVEQYQKEASIDKKKATPDDTHRASIITKEGAVIMYKDSSSAVSEEIIDSLMPMFEEAQKTKNPNLIKICAIHRMQVRRYNELIYKKLHPEENNPYNPLHKGDLIMFYNQFGKVTDPVTNVSEPLFFNSDEFSVEEVKRAPYQYTLGMTQEELAKLTKDKNVKLPNIYVQNIVVKKDGQSYNITVICPQADNIQAFKAYKSYLWQKANLLTDFEKRMELIGIINSMEEAIAEINLGYAINVFKALGSTYDTVVVDAKDIRGLRAEVKKGKSTYVDGFSVTLKLRGMYTAITRASNVTVVLRDRYAEESPIQDIKAINELINRNKAGEEVSDKEFEAAIAKTLETKEKENTPKVQPIISRTLTSVEEDTRTAMEIEDEKWNAIFEEHNNTIEFMEDSHEYWYYPLGKEHPENRVKMDTSVTTITNPVDKKYRDSKDGLDWLGVSSSIGSSADAVVRDFFMGIDITARKYPNFTIEQLRSLANDLKNFKLFLDKKFEGTKYRVVTNPFALVGKITKYNGTTQTVGGTLDILIYDEDGFYYIYDIKTSRNDLQGHSKLNNYTSQVNMYREMLEAMHPELKGCCGGLGILQLSTFYGTPKNLRFNGEDGTIMYTVDNTKQLQANGKPIEVHKEYKAPRFPEGDVQKAVIPVKETIPEQYYEDKRHKPLTISILDTYRSPEKSKAQEEHNRLDNIERATLIPNSDKHFTGQVEDESIQQIVDGDLNSIDKTDLRVVDYYKRLKSGDLLELHNKAKDQSVLVKITKPLTKKGKGYQLEFEYVEGSYTGTPIQTGTAVLSTSRTASDNLSEATVNKKTNKKFSANMWESYEDNKREDIASETTLDAIVNGERTATTRWKHIEGFYDQMKKGDLVEFHDNAGRSILVRITKAPHRLTEDLNVEEWSKKEGWSIEYFENNVLEHIEEGEAYQLEYEYIEGSYVNPEAPSRSRITDITISYKKDKDNYKKGTPQKHKDTAYVFTENAQAHNKLEGKKAIGPDVFVITNVNAAEKGRFNQADIRTNAKGEKTENAFGIIVKKYQQNASRAFVAQEGCFENTDEDFELFKKMNLEMFENLEKSDYKKMIFPFEVALGKSALPKRFTEWLKNQLESRYGIITTIEKNTTPGYRGYGLRVQEVVESKKASETKGENISSKGSEFAKKLTNYGNTVSIEFKGKTYRNAEHAYQTWKSGEFDEDAYNSTAAKPKGSKAVNKEVSDSIMVDILTAKLLQHPELVKGITDRGGIDYLNASTHDVIGDQHWETKNGKGDNGFIKALTQAYQNVTSKEVLFDEDGNPIAPISEFDSHFTVSTGAYAQRTKENADWSDITIALATDFSTAGETLTAQQAGSTDEKYLGNRKPKEGVEDKYIPSAIPSNGHDNNESIEVENAASYYAKEIYDELLKKGKTTNLKLNIAGNGIYTFTKDNFATLEELNQYVYNLISELQKLRVTISEIRSGGLTGIDEAGIIAAQRLGIKWSVNAPKNWAFRVTKEIFDTQYKDKVSREEYKENADGTVDIMNEELFKERFIPENTSSTSIQKGQKQYNKEEEDKIESIISAMPEVNTVSDKAPKGPLYTDYELELIRQREALNSLKDIDAIFKPSELSDLAKACMYLVSDFISEIQSSKDKNVDWFKYLEDGPRKQQLLDTDFTTMDRIEICHKLGMTMYEVIRSKYFNAANNPNGANMKRSLRKKLTLINENWNAFLEMGLNVVARLEGIEFDNTRVHIVNEAEEVFNGQNLEEISEIKGSAIEHWQVSFRLVSAHASLSLLIKRTLGTLFKVDENGEKVLNAFGIPERVNESLAVNLILMWTQGSENLSQMVEKLREHEKQSPWLHQIISKLDDNSEDETFKAQFWSNFKKYFQPYIIQYQKPIIGPDGESTGSILTNKVINLRSLEKQMLDDFVSLQQSRISEGTAMLLFNNDGTINQIVVKQYGEDLDKLKEYLDTYEESPEEAKAGIKVKAAIERLYRCLELELEEDTIESLADDYNIVKNIYSHALYIKTKKGLDAAIKNNTKDLDLTEHHRNDLESLFSYIVDNSTTTLESVSYEDGKLHYSYVTPSYLSNLIDKLKGNTEDYESFLEHNYGQYGWFKVGDQWRNEWLHILATDDSARRELQHAVVLTTRPVGSTVSVGYRDKSPMLYAKSMLLNYFYGGKKSLWAFYRIPIMSNKPSEEYIRFKRYIGDYYKDDLARLLVNVALQEIDRIATVRQRKSDDTTEEIKSFDKNGTKFLFLDYLQPILEEYLEWQKKHEGKTLYYSEDEDGNIVNERLLLGQMLEQRIQGTENSDNETYFNDVIISIIKQSMREKFEDYLDDMRKEGLLEQDKDGNYIHLKDLLMLEGISTEESLENFFWNDTFAAINILQLTITDIAYYKNAEDLQKRLALIHAPGLRGNAQAKWNGEVITDGKTRTIYIADFDKVISDAIENIKQAFETKAQKLEKINPEEAKQFREQAKHIIEAFEDINVTDAQGYNSPSSYRKKAIAFGKWSDELEDIYQKIRTGEYTTRDLEVMMQPLKPFVYSNATKSSVGRLGNLKIGMLNKNSEYLLLMMDAILKGEENSGNPTQSKLAAIYQVMEESHYDAEGNYKTDGIDTVQFNSTVKAGEMGVIDINNTSTTQQAKTIIENAIYLGGNKLSGYNFDRVHVLEFEDYCIQNEVPAHLEGESIFGSQMRILSISDMPEMVNGVEQSINYRGTPVSLREVKLNYMKAIADNISESMREIEKKFNITGNRAERNIALSKLLQEQIKGDSRFGYDLLYSICTDEKGNFNIPLSDPINAGRVQQLLHSIIKTRINKLMIEGGPVVLVTNFGTSKELDIVFKDAKGNRLQTLREWFATQDFSDYGSPTYEEFAVMHRYKKAKEGTPEYDMYHNTYLPLRKIVSERYKEEVASKQAGIMYIECYAPSTVFKQFADENGVIDLDKIPDSMKELIGFRIPTEFKYSMAPLKIVGLLPSEAGEGIMLPKDITTLSGSDFDEQKLR